MAERGLGGGSVDLAERLRRFQRGGGARADAARRLAERMAKTAGGRRQSVAPEHAGAVLALAWPDRIAKARGNGGFQMANGRAASVDETDPLARAEWIVIADATGRAGGARIMAAAEISEDAVLAAAGSLIEAIGSSHSIVMPARYKCGPSDDWGGSSYRANLMRLRMLKRYMD